MKKITKNGKIRTMKPLRAPEPLTKENFKPIFESIKDLIHSSAKATETVLRKEFNSAIGKVSEELALTQTALRLTKNELKEEIQGVRTELKKDMYQMEKRLTDEICQTEKRLSDKIDFNSSQLINHEGRIFALEQKAVA